jgi:hypothetical protein
MVSNVQTGLRGHLDDDVSPWIAGTMLILIAVSSFITSPSSRDRLRITLDMAQRVFTFFQVMPQFMTCMLPFGQREHSHDCTVTSFQSSNRLEKSSGGLRVPSIGRSGQQVEHCYGLKSVERAASQPEWPWSPRHCWVYHSMDLEFGTSSWIVVKANKLIQKLIRDADAAGSHHAQSNGLDLVACIAQALKVHGSIATWCGSNWPQYVAFLESTLQSMTRSTLASTMETGEVQLPVREIAATPTGPWVPPLAFDPELDEKPTTLKRVTSSFRSYVDRVPTFGKKCSTRTAAAPVESVPVARQAFSFSDLPRVHFIEEKASEVLDILENNEEVLEDLMRDYTLVFSTRQELRDSNECKTALACFAKLIEGIKKDMRRQRTRVERLVRLLASRKALVSNDTESARLAKELTLSSYRAFSSTSPHRVTGLSRRSRTP